MPIKKERKEVDISILKTPERNTRIHPEKQIAEIRRSLKKWGQYRDAVIDNKNFILAGNGLIEAMRAEGFKTAWVVVLTGITEKDKVKLMLADNKTAGLGIDNLTNIELLIQELAGDFDIPGFDDEVLASINAASEEISEALEDYGKATEENLRDIEANSCANDVPPEEGATAAESPTAEPEDGRKKYICPKCGAEIWL
jgi:hypothetical protein